jgi:hypothetical protein
MFTCSRKRSPRCFVSLADLAELKFAWQDLAASTDEGDVGKFTDAVKEFDSMTRLVQSIGNFSVFSFIIWAGASSRAVCYLR